MNLSKKSLIFVMVSSGILLLYKLYLGADFAFSLFNLVFRFGGEEAGAIGIIGGADGPSAIYTVGRLTGTFVPTLLVLALELALYVFLLVKAIKALRK